MATFPRLQGPGQLQTGDQSLQQYVPQLRADGMAAVGQGLSQLGDVTSRLQQEVRRANDARILIEADGRMRNEELEFMKWQQANPDESQWVPEAQRRLQQFEKDFEGAKLSTEGRLQLQESFNRFSTGALIRVQRDSFVQSGNRAVGAADNEARRLEDDGRFEEIPSVYTKVPESALPSYAREKRTMDAQERAKEKATQIYRKQRDNLLAQDRIDDALALTEQAFGRGLLSDEDMDAMEIAHKQQVGWMTFRQAADKDPIIARAQLMTGKFPDLTTEQKDKAGVYLESKLSEYRHRELETWANAVAVGAIKDSSQIRREWNSEAKFAEVSAEIDKLPYTPEQAAAERLELESRIRGYAKEADPDRSQMMAISARLKRMPSGTVDDLAPLWDKRRQGEEPKTKDRYMAAALQVVNERFKQRTKPFREGLTDTGPIAPKHLMKFNAEAAEAARLRIEIDKAIPEDADMETARKAVEKVMSAPVADQIESELFGEEWGWQLLLPKANQTGAPIAP